MSYCFRKKGLPQSTNKLSEEEEEEKETNAINDKTFRTTMLHYLLPRGFVSVFSLWFRSIQCFFFFSICVMWN